MSLVRIAEVQVVEALVVSLTLTDGTVIARDLEPLLTASVFDSIRKDPELFGRVRVVDGTLEWPGGLDLCPDMIIYGGPPPVDISQRAAG